MSKTREQLIAEEESLWKTSTSEHNYKYGVRIQLMMPDDLRAIIEAPWDRLEDRNPIKVAVDHAVYQARRLISNALERAEVVNDPETAKAAAHTRNSIAGAFEAADLGPIFMEEIPNEYVGDDAWALRSPWFMVTTRLGHFKVGWRKRVIELNWARANVPKGALDAVAQADETTFWKDGVHAWGYAKLTDYLKHIEVDDRNRKRDLSVPFVEEDAPLL